MSIRSLFLCTATGVVLSCSILAADPVALPDVHASSVETAEKQTQDNSEQAFFAELDKKIAAGDYKKAYQSMDAALNAYPVTYSSTWLDMFAERFLVVQGLAVSREVSRIGGGSTVDGLESMAHRIAGIYTDTFKAPQAAILFLSKIKTLSPEAFVTQFLCAHYKNGTLLPGCDFVKLAIINAIEKNDAKDIYSAYMIVTALDVTRQLLDFYPLVGRDVNGGKSIGLKLAAHFGRDVIMTVLEVHAKVMASGIKNIVNPLCKSFKSFALSQQKLIKPLAADADNVTCCMHNLKVARAQFLPRIIQGLGDGFIVSHVLSDLIVVSIKTARALQEDGQMEEARELLRAVYKKCNEVGCHKLAEGLKAYAQACPQTYQEAEPFESEYGIYVGSSCSESDTLSCLKKDTFVF